MTATIEHGALVIHCPEWCTRDHEPGDVRPCWSDTDNVALSVDHEGPHFGPFFCVACENLLTGDLLPDVTFDSVNVPEVFEKEEELRQHIADTQAALAWMESVRAAGAAG